MMLRGGEKSTVSRTDLYRSLLRILVSRSDRIQKKKKKGIGASPILILNLAPNKLFNLLKKTNKKATKTNSETKTNQFQIIKTSKSPTKNSLKLMEFESKKSK